MAQWNQSRVRFPHRSRSPKAGPHPRSLHRRAIPDVQRRCHWCRPRKEAVEPLRFRHPANPYRARLHHSLPPAPTGAAEPPAFLQLANPRRVHLRRCPHLHRPCLAATVAEGRFANLPQPAIPSLVRFRRCPCLHLRYLRLAMMAAEESPATHRPQVHPAVPLLHVRCPASTEVVARSANRPLPKHRDVRLRPDLIPASQVVAAQPANRRWREHPPRARLHRYPFPERKAEVAQSGIHLPITKPIVPLLRCPRPASTGAAVQLAILRLQAIPVGHFHRDLRSAQTAVAGPRSHPPQTTNSILDHHSRLAPRVEAARPPNHCLTMRWRGLLRTGCCFPATNLARWAAARSRLRSAR
jgi:hypothetical protein